MHPRTLGIFAGFALAVAVAFAVVMTGSDDETGLDPSTVESDAEESTDGGAARRSDGGGSRGGKKDVPDSSGAPEPSTRIAPVTVSGRVVPFRGGRPAEPDASLAGIAVTAVVQVDGRDLLPRPSATTEADGAFTIRLPHGAGGHVEAWAEGWAVSRRPVLAGAAPSKGIVLLLVPGGTVRGRVTGPGGSPAAARVGMEYPYRSSQCNVVLQEPQEQFGPRIVETDAEGAFTLRGIPVDRRFRLVAEAARAGCRSGMLRLAESTRPLDVDLRLRAWAAFAGRVRWDDETPAAELDLVLAPRSLSCAVWRATTDGEGRFDLGHMPAGSYRLSARAPDGPAFDFDEPFVLGAGEERRDDVIVLPKGLVISGSLLVDTETDTDIGAAYAALRLEGDGVDLLASTDQDGRFRFRCLAAGKYRLRLNEPDLRLLDRVEVAAGSEGLSLRAVKASARVEGDVRGPDGAPVKRFKVVVRDEPGGYERLTVDGEGGSWRSKPLPPGGYEVTWTTWGRAPVVAHLTLDEDTTTRHDVKFAENAAIVSGVVLDAAGRPLAGAEVRVATIVEATQEVLPGVRGKVRSDETVLASKTDADGAFDLRPPVPNGVVVITHAEHAEMRIPWLGAGYEDLRIRMKKGATVRGRLVSGGRAEGSAHVNLVLTRRGHCFMRGRDLATDAEGAFDIDRVPAGEWRLCVMATRDRVASWYDFSVGEGDVDLGDVSPW